MRNIKGTEKYVRNSWEICVKNPVTEIFMRIIKGELKKGTENHATVWRNLYNESY